MQPEIFFQIVVIVYSIILHEVAHGYAAYAFGDKTAFYQNRLTLNPLPHIDMVGSIVVPTLLLLTGSNILAGWAKPVPVSEHNLNPHKLGSFVVSVAGVAINFALAFIFILIGANISDISIKNLCALIATTNIGLAIFNLIPVPPADGYRILSVFLPAQTKRQIEHFIQNYFFVTILVAILIATQIFTLIFPLFNRIIQNFIY